MFLLVYLIELAKQDCLPGDFLCWRLSEEKPAISAKIMTQRVEEVPKGNLGGSQEADPGSAHRQKA